MSRDVITQPMKPNLLPSGSQNSNLRKTSIIFNQKPKEIVHLKQEQQLLSILEKGLNQVEVALTFQPDRVADIKDISLCRALQTHQLLCDRLERAEEQGRKVVKGGSDAQFKSEFKKSYKKLLRCFRDAPVDFAQIKQGLDGEMGKAEQVLYENLKTIIHCTLEEEKQEEALLKIKPFQDPKSEAALDERIASVTKQISRIDEKIEDCKASMDKLKIPQMSETPLTDQQYQSYLNTPEQLSLQQELEQLDAQLNKLFLEDREEERDIQEGTDMIEGEIEYIIEEFDEKMEEMQADLEAKEAELHKIEEEQRSLEKLLTALEGEYNEIVAKRLLAEENMIEERRILQLKTKAAIMIQAWWRGYCIRKAMKNKAKKKGKKGKGKKKLM